MSALTAAIVEEAIVAHLRTGQKYLLPDGTCVDRGSLAEKIALRDKLKVEEAAAGTGGGILYPVQFRRD